MDRDALKIYRSLVNAHLRREKVWEPADEPEPAPEPDRMFTRDDRTFLTSIRVAPF